MAERKNSKKRIATNNRWTNAHYDRINIAVPKGRKDEIKALADTQGRSVNAYIISALDEKMERDGGGMASETAGKGLESTSGAGVVSLPSEAVRTAQESAETGKWPVPADKAKAVEKLFTIFENFGTADLDKARFERLGIVYLPPDTLEAAQQAAEAAGEGLPEFVARAVETQAQRDKASLRMGINPATGGKLEKEA